MFKGLVKFCGDNEKLITGVLIIAIIIVAISAYNKWQKKTDAEAATSSAAPSGENYRYIGAAIGSGLYREILSGRGGSDNLGGGLSNVRFDSGLLSKDPNYDLINEQVKEMGQTGFSGYQPTTPGLILDPMAFTSLPLSDPYGMDFGSM